MIRRLAILLCLAALACARAAATTAFEIPASSSQLILGLADDWSSSKATLRLYQKSNGRWQQVGDTWPARLGRDGLAWGLGLHPVPAGAVMKKEGDMRAPAGVFSIGGAWGYEASIRKHPRLFYRQVTPHDLWVEDPESPDYNRNVILDRAPSTSWEKKQQMKQNDPAHSLKLFIAHNAPPKVRPHAGSSIFFHIWRAGGTRPSAGCTTMEESRLRSLISTIDPTRHPLYVLLPAAEYKRVRSAWKLP